MPIQDPNKPPQDGSYRLDQGPTPIPSGGKALELEDKRLKPPVYQSKRDRALTRQRRNVTRFERSVGNYFEDLEPKLKALVPHTKSTGRKATRTWDYWTTGLTNVLRRLIRETVGAEGRHQAQLLGGTFDQARTKNYREGMASGAAEQIMSTIRQEVENLGLDATVARLPAHAASAGGSLGVRSTIWARQEAARQSPHSHLRQETWVRDTERHAAYDGKSVGLGQKWAGGITPGSTPGCRCTAVIS